MCLQLLPDGADSLALHECVQDHAGHVRAVDDLAGVAAPGAILLFAARSLVPAGIKGAKAEGAVLLQGVAGKSLAIQSLH